MHYLLTGSGGFIGRNLIDFIIKNEVLSEQDKVYTISKKDSELNSKKIIPIRVKSYKFESDLLIDVNVDVLILLGSYSPKENSSLEINRCLDSIESVKSILNYLKKPPKKIIFCSSLDVYKTSAEIINESSKIGPDTFYGSMKFFLEGYIKFWAESKGIIFQILRLGHIYGPGEVHYKKIIPVTITKLLGNEPPVIYSDGSELRSYLYVDDCCKLIWESILLAKSVGPINIVSSNTKSINDIVQILCGFKSDSLKPEILYKSIAVKDMVFDNSKMVKYLGTEKVTIEEGLKFEWDYFNEIFHGMKE